MSFRNRGRGRRAHTPITPKGTIYGPPSSQHLAAEVSQTSIPAARESVEKLEREFRQEKTRDAKMRRYRAAELEATRLKQDLNRTDLHRDTRARLETEAGIYQRAADRMRRELTE